MANTFKAATWNVFHGSKPEDLEPTLKRLLADGVSLFLFQEVSDPAVRRMLRDNGLEVAFAPRQYAIAWDPEVWVGIDSDDVVLSEQTYWTKGGHPMPSRAATAILSDRLGRTLTALSYHTPAGVQTKNPPKRRLAALRDSMETLTRLADEAETRAILFGGDDNVDEWRGPWQKRFRFMRRGPMELLQIRAPKGTFGKRKIDDFRVRGLKPLGGEVVKNASDHKVHVRTFRWA